MVDDGTAASGSESQCNVRTKTAEELECMKRRTSCQHMEHSLRGVTHRGGGIAKERVPGGVSLCQECLSHFDHSTSSSPMAAASAVILPHHCSRIGMSTQRRMRRRPCISRRFMNFKEAWGKPILACSGCGFSTKQLNVLSCLRLLLTQCNITLFSMRLAVELVLY